MNFQFGSQHIAFKILFPSGVWEIRPTQKSIPHLKSAPISLIWHSHQKRYAWLAEEDPHATSESHHFQKVIGSCHLITMEWELEEGHLHKKVEYAISENHPIIQWRFHVSNLTGKAAHLDRIDMLRTGIINPKGLKTSDTYGRLTQLEGSKALGLDFEEENPEFAFYTNGWQSWNYSGTLDINDPFPWSRLGPLDQPMRMNTGTPRPMRKGHFISDFFAVFGDRKSRMGLILGFLSQRQVFGTVESWVDPKLPTLQMWANSDGVCIKPGQTFTTDWAYLEIADLNHQDPLSTYFEAVAAENDVKGNHTSPIGWCSWYHAFESVSEQWMMENIAWASVNRERIPLKVIQLDDGYEKWVGDWFSWKGSFPNGIETIGNAIREADFMPGIWIAPFIAKRQSEIARQKPEWILRNRFKLPVSPGFLWNSFPCVLDITHPEVIEHLRRLIKRFVQELGYEYLKLDFLYAGALPGKRYNPSVTRAQGLYQALQVIRDAAGQETELLGCGCPLGSGIGIFDFMRIGPDVAPRWKPYYKGIETFLETEKGLPSARNAILTTVNRLPMHNRWWVNDPDCLILRSSDTHLSEAEVQTLTSVIAMSGGALILSDHLPSLAEERVNWFARLIPPLPKAALALDWFNTSHPSKLMMNLNGQAGSWKLITLINWDDQPADLILDLDDFNLETSSDHHLIDYWNEDYDRLSTAAISFKGVPPHGVRMLSIRECSPEPQWLGDTLHISQGLIVKDWRLNSDQLLVQLDLGREANGKAWIALNHPMRESWLDDQEIAFEEIAPGIYRLYLKINRKALLRISW